MPDDPRGVTKEMAEWLEEQPLTIRTMASEFPLASEVFSGSYTVYVVGYLEVGSLLVSDTDPDLDHDLAVATRWPMCLDCAREQESFCAEVCWRLDGGRLTREEVSWEHLSRRDFGDLEGRTPGPALEGGDEALQD